MTDEIGLGLRTQRAAQAQRLLDDDLLLEAFTTIHEDLMRLWINTKVDDQASRERIWSVVKLNEKYRDFLKMAIMDGKIAQRELDELTAKHGQFKAA